ncbi:hypothetical protein [uncultured Jannaschia sp.]|uniref:hypothetical protein n=1 Tax=uncultured Jannaschia sp. TaxID=293347 RepID=UPI00262AEC9D|nr:hypothetical protein [uncultured Jannaschia sp.]
MHSIKSSLIVAAALLLAGPALAQDCAGRIDDFERILDRAAGEAISASSGGQAVAGAREAQAMEAPEEGAEDPVPFQEEDEEAAEVEEAEEAGEGGERIIQARTALQNARELAEGGDEAACSEAMDDLVLTLLED